ncbi:MAG: hypothetical protein JW827_10140 [Spirochaetes bacterium]|nr:hypothetical protein [Spirochaetota bacterium]
MSQLFPKMRTTSLIVLLVTIFGCTWTPRNVLPEYFRTIHVPTFGNETMEPQIGSELTKKVITEFELDGRLTITEHVSKAEGVLFCVITKYKKVPISYNSMGEVDTTTMIMGAELKLRDIRSGEWFHDGYVEEQIDYNLKSEPVESEIEAMERIMNNLAKRIVSKTIEGW